MTTYEVDPDWLLLGRGDIYTKEGRPKRSEIIIQPHIHIAPATARLDDLIESDFAVYLAVPLVEGRIAAGPGRIVEENIQSFVWVYQPEVGKRKNLVAVKLGDNERSMIPILPPGAIVILDPDDKQPERNGIYAVRTGGDGCAVKRIYKSGDLVLLMSDNPEYAPEKAETDNMDDLIIGRVIWSWQSFVK